MIRRETGIYYTFDRVTGKRESLGTKDCEAAARLLAAKNEALKQQTIVNLQLARVYLSASDPQTTQRTWSTVFEEVVKAKTGASRIRWERAAKDKAFEPIRNLPLFETRAEDLLRALARGTVATNVFLRRFHNFALDMNWLVVPVVPKKQWPKIRFKEKRAITWDEHLKIIDREQNPERRAFYELLWHLGGAQSDIANLRAEDIDWRDQVISFTRQKLRGRVVEPVQISFGSYLAAILGKLPRTGLLFPNLAPMTAGHRATEFRRICRRAGITERLTLHCYRYAWAERAKKAGMPERFAMQALGHNSPAMHRAYARKAHVKVPALEDYEKNMNKNVIKLTDLRETLADRPS